MNIDRNIEKTNRKRRERPKEVNNKKAIPLFLFPCEAVIYQKSDTINLKKNVLAGNAEQARYEMEILLQKNNVFDYEISVIMPQGHPVNIISESAGRSIYNTFKPFILAAEKKAAKQKRLDLQAASRSSKIDLARDGINDLDLNKKLQQAHNQSKYIG